MKTERFGFRLSIIETKILQDLAEALGGLSQGALIRLLIREKASQLKVPAENYNNQNDISKKINSTHSSDVSRG
jgi:hypothetical protein